MKYYVCKGCPDEKPCVCGIADDPLPPKTCLTTKVVCKDWLEVSLEEFLDEVDMLEEKK